ncbi:putative membrane protein YczE [Leucobacter exalbidus]|uniref:Membrane protein YczE n=1 Tax=Leucobacter exalbidus TaxID=662960 RepID=A0A940PP15_9MICO|nr:hypothetical protein [Leucobacter exalbidus]MBP1327502.1 putative membrane protein YczE [Leucobacter exalbidus]
MVLRLSRLVPGLLLYGIADAFMMRAELGVSPWLVFSQGLSSVTGMNIGLLTNLIGLVVLLAWIPLRQRPGIGTVLNIMLVGPGLSLGLWLLPTPELLVVRIGYFVFGLLLLAVASGIYIGTHLGPGPRDGLMIGIHARFWTPLWLARTGVEVTVLAVGWVFGGDVGLGTVAFALLIGPLCGFTLPFFDPALRRSGKTPTPRPEAGEALASDGAESDQSKEVTEGSTVRRAESC